MNMFEIVLQLFGGLLFLFGGAELLIRGSTSLALRLGITPLVIGLTVVAFGTSSPELVVSISASLSGNSGIVLGNVLGSNICNIALILGISALIKPMHIKIQVIKREIPIMIGATVFLVLIVLVGPINRIEGIILFVGIISYLGLSIYWAKKEQKSIGSYIIKKEISKPLTNMLLTTIFLIAGIILLTIGSELFVKSAVEIAIRMGISQIVIGITIVALGTSLPELVTSMVASFEREADIAVGNVVGSNLFNILCILGVASILRPISTAEVSPIDLIVLLILSFALLPLSKTGFKLSRLEGAFLLVVYTGYIFYLLN